MKNEKKSLLSALSVFCDTLGVGIRNTNRYLKKIYLFFILFFPSLFCLSFPNPFFFNRSKRMLICNILKKWYELRQKEVGKRGEGEGGLREVFKGFVETVKERDGMVVGRTLGALLGGATGIFSSFSSVEPLAVSPSPSVPLTSSVSVGNFGSQKKKMRTKTDVKWAEDEMKEGGRSVTMVEMKGLRVFFFSFLIFFSFLFFSFLFFSFLFFSFLFFSFLFSFLTPPPSTVFRLLPTTHHP